MQLGGFPEPFLENNLKEGVIEELIEVKYYDEKLSQHLRYYTKKLNPPKATQMLATLKKPFDKNGIRITDPVSYFSLSFYDIN